jgi:hypothetical protein
MSKKTEHESVLQCNPVSRVSVLDDGHCTCLSPALPLFIPFVFSTLPGLWCPRSSQRCRWRLKASRLWLLVAWKTVNDFRRKVWLPSEGSENCIYPEDWGRTSLRNVGNYLRVGTPLYPRRLGSPLSCYLRFWKSVPSVSAFSVVLRGKG